MNETILGLARSNSTTIISSCYYDSNAKLNDQVVNTVLQKHTSHEEQAMVKTVKESRAMVVAFNPST